MSVHEARFADFIKRLFGRHESTELTLLPDIMPTVDILSTLPELLRLRSERCFTSAAAMAAPGAGNVTGLRLANNAPNVLAVVEEISVASHLGVAASFGISVTDATTASLTNAITERASDTREYTLLARLAASWGAVAGAAPYPMDVAIGAVPAWGAWHLRRPLVVLPGHAVDVFTIPQNVSLSVSVLWRERTVDESETGRAV